MTKFNIDITEEAIRKFDAKTLNILLLDRTTGKNILWAVKDYEALGSRYLPNHEITVESVTGANSDVIQPRIMKRTASQNSRTKEKAEVFTPSWVCNMQNNLVDERWFGAKAVFNTASGQTWEPTTDKIKFPDKRNRTWNKYVDAKRLEVTCGEAPYLVSRYDTVTGEPIPVPARIGILDRKLRIVDENAASDEEWLIWVYRAFESVYGFEYQGDSLLLARENLLLTFVDHVEARLKRRPTVQELRRIAAIVSWNIWQMDGLKYTVPFSEKIIEDTHQMALFDEEAGQERTARFCRIKDWRAKEILEFRTLLGKG